MERDEYRKVGIEFSRSYEELREYMHNEQLESTIEMKSLVQFVYIHILEIGTSEDNSLVDKLLNSLYGLQIEFSLVYKLIDDQLHLYIGTDAEKIVTLERIIKGIISALKIENNGRTKYRECNEIFLEKHLSYGGFIKGDALIEESPNALIDTLLKGVFGNEFLLVIVANPLKKETINMFLEQWGAIKNLGDILKNIQITVRDERETISYQESNYKIMNYIEMVNEFYKKFHMGLQEGLWDVTIKYFANQINIAETIAGIIMANGYGKENKLEPFHRIKSKNFLIAYNDKIVNDSVEINLGNGKHIELPKYSNIYVTSQIAAVASLPKEDFFGISVREQVDFDTHRNTKGDLDLGKILYKNNETNNMYDININDLNRHTLIVGLTGAGKTNTIKNILLNLKDRKKHIPFMLIEPAKREYWELYKLGFDDLKVFCVGSFVNCGYKINPFEKIGDISVQSHIEYVFSAFKASFIMYTPMPYVLERAIYSIYEDCGWNVRTGKNKLGNVYPTIENLYYKIPYVVKEMGYDEKMQKDLVGALQARVNSLRIGSKGETLNVKKSYDIGNILKQNVIIELEDIGDDDVKAFIISMLLIQLSEYRMQEEDAQLETKHILLIEEAHRLLKNVSSGSGEAADPRGNAVEFFCNMLAELRSKGQAFIIADQIPSKLAPDIVKNTNLKIVHRLVAEDERVLVGKSMHMTEAQVDYLSTLKQGVAAVYSESDNRPKLVKAEYAGRKLLSERKNMKHNEICKIVTLKEKEEETQYINQSELDYICSACPCECDGKESMKIFDIINENAINKYLEVYKKNQTKEALEIVISEILCELKRFSVEQVYKNKKLVYCFLYLFCKEMKFTLKEKQQVIRVSQEIIKEIE